MILQAAMNGATKTRLMYSAYLSYAQIQEYVRFLMGKNLLMLQAGTQKYKLTETGIHFLRVYEKISGLVFLNKGKESFAPAVVANE